MSEAVKSELWLFFISVITGAVTGIIFDFFRAMRKIGGESKKIVGVEDILFWICEAVLIFSVLYNFNGGQLRFYFFIGLVSGAAIYLLSVSLAVVFLFEKTGVFIKALISVVIKILKSIGGIFIKPLLFLIRKANKGARKIKKRLKMY